MKVYLKPASGSATDNLERAKAEMEWVLGFRGKVTDAKVGQWVSLKLAGIKLTGDEIAALFVVAYGYASVVLMR